MAYSRRSYKGAPVTNALAAGTLAAGGTSINLATAMSGWSTDGTPFFVVVDPGTAKEEKICVKYNTSTNLTVVDPAVTSGWTASANGRGVDNTTDRQHDAGAVIYPVFTALEANQANELVSKYTTNGDIVVHGSTGPKTISTGGSGSNNKVLVADSTVSDGGVKWASITSDMITDGTIVNADISASAAIAMSKLATGALPTDITVASANIVNGTIVNADINASAAIELSKLATGALPTGITVASANLVDLTIDTADIKDDAVTAAKIAANAVGSSEIATGAVGTDEIADNAVTNAKLPSNSFALTYQDFTASTNITANPYGEDVKVTLTGGKVYTDVVSVTAWGTNSNARVLSWQVGVWANVQTSAEVVVNVLLGNNVASNNVTIRVWLK